MLRLRLATLFGCPLAELDARLPASELPLWDALQHIEPWGWQAADIQGAKLARRLWSVHRGSDGLPPFSEFLTPLPDWRMFDAELKEQVESDRLVRNLKSVMR